MQGLSESTEYFELQFDSLDTRVSASGLNASTDWPRFYLGRPLSNIAGLKIIEAQIPFSYYIFNTQNNTFLLNVAGVATNAVVTIPVGNYTSSTMLVALKTALDNAMLAQTPGTSLRWTVNIIPATQKFTMMLNTNLVSAATSFTFGTADDLGNFNPRLYLGFPAGVTSAIFQSGVGMIIEAPNANLITGPNYVYINSIKLGALCNLYLPAGAGNLSGGNSGPQLAKVPINVQPGGIVYWCDPTPEYFFDVENLGSITDADFYLTLGNTSNEVPLKLNGLSFSLKLAVLINKTVSNYTINNGDSAKIYRKLIPR